VAGRPPAEAQRTGRGAGRVEGVVDGDDRGPSTIPERPSGRGEPQVVRAALDEADAQVRLELLQRPRQRGLGQVQPRRRSRDVPLVRDGDERPQVAQLSGHVHRA